MPTFSRKDADRLAKIEEWSKNHDKQHDTKQTTTQVFITGTFVLIAAILASGITGYITYLITK